MLDMGLLGILVQRLEPPVSAAGYVLVERADDGDPAWIEYRRRTVDSLRMLSISYSAASGTLHAAIWRPPDLVGAASAAEAERAVEWQQIWRHTPATDPDALAAEIERTISSLVVSPPDAGKGAEP